MEMTLGILMALGIFVAIPALIGFAIAGACILIAHRTRRTERAKAPADAKASSSVKG